MYVRDPLQVVVTGPLLSRYGGRSLRDGYNAQLKSDAHLVV
jgi:hypothetical protein